jgi:hypothetical protein
MYAGGWMDVGVIVMRQRVAFAHAAARIQVGLLAKDQSLALRRGQTISPPLSSSSGQRLFEALPLFGNLALFPLRYDGNKELIGFVSQIRKHAPFGTGRSAQQ